MAERRSVAADVVGSKPTSRPNSPLKLNGISLRTGKPSLTTPMPASKTASAPPNLFAGTSGWAYPTWRPGFYPADVSPKRFLSFYASQLNSVEVNYTFTKLPTSAIVAEWLAATPPGFRFTFKAPQRITHFSRLIDCEPHLAAFFAAIAPVAAAGKLGQILFQLPPNFKANLPRLEAFLANPSLNSPATPPIAFEFRHQSWFTPPFGNETEALLARHNAALCIAETEDFLSPEIHPSSTHTSFRLRHSGGYKPRQVTALAARILPLAAAGRDVYVYFKHEDEPTGALNATAFLKQALKLAKAQPK